MPKFGIKLNQANLNTLKRDLASLDRYPKIAKKIIKSEADKAVVRMKKDAPFDTGRLKRNIKVTNVTSDDLTIKSEAINPTTGVDYSYAQEYGLGPGKFTPYFRHNVHILITRLSARLKKALKKLP